MDIPTILAMKDRRYMIIPIEKIKVISFCCGKDIFAGAFGGGRVPVIARPELAMAG